MILITGASGLLGANLVLQASQRNLKITALFHYHKLVYPGLNSIQADLRDKELVHNLLRDIQPECIIHCAALTHVDHCEHYPTAAHRINVGLTRNLAESANKLDALFVYISTDSVFSGHRGNYSEEHIPTPMNEYAKSKYSGEQVVQEELNSSLILRTNFYGWNMQQKNSLSEWMLSRLESGQILHGFHDVFFSPILVSDLCEIILDMIERRLTGVYHVTGSQKCSKYEFALKLAEIFDYSTDLVKKISVKKAHLKAFRSRNTSLNCDKVSQALGINLPDLASGFINLKNQRVIGFESKLKEMRGEFHDASNENWQEGNWSQSADLFHC